MIALDSSFLVACFHQGDRHHASARATLDRIRAREWGPALLHEYVLLEVVTVLAARKDQATANAAADALLQAAEVEVVAGVETFRDALAIFTGQKRARLSFADASVVALCRARGVAEVATFDADFEGLPGIRVVP